MNITSFYSQEFSSNAPCTKPTLKEMVEKAADEAVKKNSKKEEENGSHSSEGTTPQITENDITNWNNKPNMSDITEQLSSYLKSSDLENELNGYAKTEEVEQELASYINGAEYTDNKILFKHDETTIAEINASDFIKDGMVSNVEISGGKLVITFNADADNKVVEINLSDIFDASNYYTKDEVDRAIENIDIPTVPTNVSELTNDANYITAQDIDIPNVPEWALAQEKPQYTAQEVGALPSDTVIPTVPTNVSDFTNDAGYLTSFTETDPTVPAWAKEPNKPTYTAQEVGALPSDTVIPTVPTNVSDFTNDANYITAQDIDIPNVPEWALAQEKPTYTAQEVGALPSDTVIPSIEGLATEDFVGDEIAKIEIPSLDGYATMEDIVNYCPTIEDTRNGNSNDITGVAPFETLEDGQRIILHLTYATEPNSTLNLTLSDGTTTGAKDIKYQVPNTVLPQPISEKYGKYMPNRYVEMTYDKPKNHWVCMTAVNAVNKFKTINNETILGEGNISFTETEPLFNESVAKDISSEDINTWNGKQDALTFDNQPMEDSDNPVKSRGIKTYVDEKVAEVVNNAGADFDTLGEAQEKYNELNAKYIALHNVVYGMADSAAATEMNPEYVANTISSGNRNVVVEKGELGDVTIPEVTGSTTVTAPMAVTPKSGDEDTYSTITLTTPNKSFTLTNTTPSDEQNPVNVEVDAPYNDNSTSNTTVYLQGEYENITVENASIGKASDREAPVVHNITVNNNVDEDVEEPKQKSSTINATFTGDANDPSVVTSNVPTLTITNYNPAVDENENPITPPSLVIDAEESTVNLNSKWDEVSATVSDNTLIINGSAHINKLTCAQKVIVKVSKQSKIDEVITDYTGVDVDYTKVDITNANQSQMTNTAECTLTENISKTYGWTFGTLSSDYPVWKLNGYNITIQKERVGAVLLRNKACLDIYGPGRIESQDYGVWTGSEDNVVNVYGGDFICTDHALYAEKGTINVYGGTFRVTSEDKRYVLNCLDASYTADPRKANINVYGGKFYDFDPSNSMGEPNGPVSFVAPGYRVIQGTDEVGNYYEVVAD